MDYPHYCYVHGGCRTPCCTPCMPPAPPISPCNCREKVVVESKPNVLSLCSQVIEHTGANLLYYSIGVNTRNVLNNPPGVITNLVPIPFIFPRASKIVKLIGQFIFTDTVTLTGNLTVSVQLYNALLPLNGAQFIYGNIFSQQIAALTGSINAGATYTIESELSLPIQMNSSLAVVFAVSNTVDEVINLKFISGILYC